MENIPILDAEQPADTYRPIEVPPSYPAVSIVLASGKRFDASRDNWSYEEQGVFAKGRFKHSRNDHQQCNDQLVLIPYNRIEYFVFHGVADGD